MTPDEYTTLTKDPNPISGAILVNQSDRTLLYGYDLDRNTIHVYLQKGVLHRLVYRNETMISCRTGVFHVEDDLIPSKRLYPERCDFEFCKLLQARGLSLSFTRYPTQSPPQRLPFYGMRIEDF